MVMADKRRKRNKNDAVAVSVKNALEQQHLEARLLDLERIWHIELKHLTRERLELTKDMQNFYDERIDSEYLDHSLRGDPLKTYSKEFRARLAIRQNIARTKLRYDFDQKKVNETVHIRLPPIERPISILQENGTTAAYNTTEKPKFYRYHSNISLRKSISDPDLFRMQTNTLRGRTTYDKRSSTVCANLPNISYTTQVKSNKKEPENQTNDSQNPQTKRLNSGFITNTSKSVYDKIRLNSRQGKSKIRTAYKPSILNAIPRLVSTSHKKTRKVRSTDIPETGTTPDVVSNRKHGKPLALPPLGERRHTVL